MREELCRKIALGSLVQGHFHNLKGILQNIFIEFYPLLKAQNSFPEPLYQKVKKIYQLFSELNRYLSTAIEDVKREEEGPWNLRELIEDEIRFYRGDFNFKHKVKVEIIEEEECLLKIPWFLIRGLMCEIGQKLFLELEEEELKIVLRSEEINFYWITFLKEEKVLALKLTLDIYQNIVSSVVHPTSLKLVFKENYVWKKNCCG